MKILLYTDLTIRPDQIFWHRDLGHNALLVVHLATEPRTTPAISNELDHPREQPFGAQQDLPRLSALGRQPCVAQQGLPRPSAIGRQPCVAQQGLPRPSVAGPHPTSATSSKIKNPRAGASLPRPGRGRNRGEKSASAPFEAPPFEAPPERSKVWSEVGPHPTSATSSKIKHPTSKILEDPVLWPSPSDVLNPLWWQSQKPHLLILGL